MKELENIGSLLEHAGIGVAVLDADARVVAHNRSLATLLGVETLVGTGIIDRFHPEDPPANRAALDELLAGHRDHLATERRYRCADGSFVWLRTTLTTREAPAGHFFMSFEDVTLLRSEAEALRRVQERNEQQRAHLRDHAVLLLTVIENMAEGVVVTDGRGGVIMVNAAIERLLGVRFVDVDIGRRIDGVRFETAAGRELRPEELPFGLALRGEAVHERMVLVRSPYAPAGRWISINASPIHAADGSVRGMVGVTRDVHEEKLATEALAARAEDSHAQSITDELTGLLNRRGFQLFAERQLALAVRHHHPAVVLFCDLDGMKAINDSHGHLAGDDALRAAAAALRETFRTTDIIARLGGDEFVVFAPETAAGDAEFLAARLKDRLGLSRLPVPLAVSVGLAVFVPGAPATLASLVAEADAQMYEVKRQRSA
jgi:diguanylate cyclase (GGDEF)-like protein/PAS domain S-box-containing protein